MLARRTGMRRSFYYTRLGLLAAAVLATIFTPAGPAITTRASDLGAGQGPGPVAQLPPGANVSPLFGNLGSHSHRITTSSELAQRYFDEGLNLVFGFNHAEAIRSFKDAITVDPSCAMCHWGIALALGPNINAPMDDSAIPDALSALERAIELAPAASPADQAYIQALSTRYSAAPDADRVELDMAYVNAMRDLARQYPDDLDA